MTTLTMSIPGRDMLEHFERCNLASYWDINGWAIGYGLHTGAAPGLTVTQGMTISQDSADFWLTEALDANYEPVLNGLLGNAPTTQSQFDAMLSLMYNIGAGAFHRSTVLHDHLDGEFVGASYAFALWDISKGKQNSALLARRLKEATLYRNGIYPTF